MRPFGIGGHWYRTYAALAGSIDATQDPLGTSSLHDTDDDAHDADVGYRVMTTVPPTHDAIMDAVHEPSSSNSVALAEDKDPSPPQVPKSA